MNNSSGRVGVALAAMAVAVCVGWAEEKPTIYPSSTSASDAAGATSFDTGNCWSNKLPPGPGTNYVWNSSGNFRTPQNTGSSIDYVFAGDSLRFTAGAIAAKTTSPLNKADSERNRIVFPDLTLAKSDMAFAQSSGPNTLAWICGQITVEENFGFRASVGSSDDQCRYDFRIEASLKGGAGKTVAINHYNAIKSPRCPNVTHITGDNSAYLGKWKVHNFASANTLEGMVMSVESATALGAELDAPMADAITLANSGALAVAPELCADGPFAPKNRGITLAAPAGRLTTLSNETWSLGMPIVGNCPLVKGGAGRVALCGPYSGGAITVEQGTLRFGAGFSAPAGLPTVTVEEGAAFELESPVAGATLAGFAVPEGTVFVVPLNVAEGTARTVALDADSTLPADGKVKVSFDAALPLDAASDAEFPILTVPASVRALAAEDVEDVSPQNAYHLPKVVFSVKDNADGVQTVYAKIRPLVANNPAATGDGSKWWTTTQKSGDIYLWEDGLAAHAGADYLVTNNMSLRAAVNARQEAVDGEFAGETLTFYNDGALAMKCRRMTFKNLQLGPDRQVVSSGCGEKMQYVAGHVTAIGAFGSKAAHFDATRSQSITLEAACHGEGSLRMQVYENNVVNDYTNVWTAITGDNSDFRGRFYFYSRYGNALTNGVSCRFDSPENLGGPMAARTCNGLHLQSNCALSPTRTMTLETENRGIYSEFGRFDIPKGVELTVKQPISLNGSLAKEGEGTLTISTPVYFGMTFSAGPNYNNFLDVRAGGVKPTTVDALKSLQTTFRRDGRLVLDAEPEETALAEQGVFVRDAVGVDFDAPDGVLNVEIVASQAFLEARQEFSVPVCTVSQAIADKIDGKIKMARIKGWQGVVSREALDSGMARFTMNVSRKGAVLILR